MSLDDMIDEESEGESDRDIVCPLCEGSDVDIVNQTLTSCSNDNCPIYTFDSRHHKYE